MWRFFASKQCSENKVWFGKKKKSFPSLNWKYSYKIFGVTKIFGVGNDLPYAWWGFSTLSSIQPGTINEPIGELGTKESSCVFWERSCLHHVPTQGPVKLEHKNDAAQRGLHAWSRPKATQSTRCARMPESNVNHLQPRTSPTPRGPRS